MKRKFKVKNKKKLRKEKTNVQIEGEQDQNNEKLPENSPQQEIQQDQDQDIAEIPQKYHKWQDRLYVEIYELARSGMSERKIAETIGISMTTFQKWKSVSKRPVPSEMKAILAKAREKRKESIGDFHDFVYGRLPVDLQEAWDKIARGDSTNLQEYSKQEKQQLFFYAFVSCNFSISEACRVLDIPRRTVHAWKEGDQNFKKIMDEMHDAKKDFFESHLINCVKEGNVPATIFANKTFNRERGYGEKTQIEHTGRIEHQHNHTLVSVNELRLPLKIRMQLLHAIEMYEAKNKELPLLENKDGEIIEAEFEKLAV